MAATQCPKCGAKVQPTDTLCLDCGADLLAERRRAEQMIFQTARLPAAAAAPPRAAAATGRAEFGESSDQTRLRVFDKQFAEALVTERLTAYATAAIACVILILAAFFATEQIRAAGGLTGLKTVTPAGIRQLGWSVFTDPAVTGMWLALTAVSAFLCLVGQIVRAILAGRSIRAVEAGGKPAIVGISIATQGGLVLFSAICPPAGIIVGAILKLRRDEETAAFGGVMMWVGFIALLALAINCLWGLAEHLRTKPRPEPAVPRATLLLYPVWAIVSSRISRRKKS